MLCIMMQLNPKLKYLICHTDFHDAAPLLLGEKFRYMAKERLEAAKVFKKIMSSDCSKRGFQKSHPQRKSCVGNNLYNSNGGSQGWNGPGN